MELYSHKMYYISFVGSAGEDFPRLGTSCRNDGREETGRYCSELDDTLKQLPPTMETGRFS